MREAADTVTDFAGSSKALIDLYAKASTQRVAGNMKLAAELQKTIVETGYAKAFR